jgi:hypothetical protein
MALRDQSTAVRTPRVTRRVAHLAAIARAYRIAHATE